MPPKRKRPDPDTPAPSSSSTVTSIAAPNVAPSSQDSAVSVSISSANDGSVSAAPSSPVSNPQQVDTRPLCMYGSKCYRKNPKHLTEFRHPTSVVSVPAPASPSDDAPAEPKAIKRKLSGSEQVAAAVAASPAKYQLKDLEVYTAMLKHCLSQSKVSVAEKRMLRTYRRDHVIDDGEHERLVQQFGWTTDEYEDGERKISTDLEIDEELPIQRAYDLYKVDPANNKLPEGQVIWITPESAKSNTKYQNVFSKAAAHFYQTMSQAQVNYLVTRVGVILNPACADRFSKKKDVFANAHIDNDEEWGFHGTSKESVLGIAKTGFLHPKDIKSANNQPKKGSANGLLAKVFGTAKPANINLLDSGFFGSGIYFSFYSDYAVFYASSRGSNQLLLCKVLRGKCFKCTKRMDGQACQPGFHSHFSPKGNEIILFEPDQILPRYVIEFGIKKAVTKPNEY